MPMHMLLITASFVPQESPLSRADFEAIDEVISKFPQIKNWLFFYNSGNDEIVLMVIYLGLGELSGASQPHKHFQMIPNCIPPIHQTILNLNGCMFAKATNAVERWLAYQAFGKDNNRSHNLLFTTELIMYVPRKCAQFKGISMNALAFGGFLLARTEAERTLLLDQVDPFHVLSLL